MIKLVLTSLLGCLKVLFRDDYNSRKSASADLFNRLLQIACEKNTDPSIQMCAFQCFTNLLNRNAGAVNLFISHSAGVKGLARLLDILTSPSSCTVLYYATRLLLLLVSLW